MPNLGSAKSRFTPGTRKNHIYIATWAVHILRMPFALKKAPNTAHRAMDIILLKVKWQFALVYFDDVGIFWRSVKENLEIYRLY